MYSKRLLIFKKRNLKVTLLIGILTISMLSIGIPFTQTVASNSASMLRKVSLKLFSKIQTEGSPTVNVLIQTSTSDYSTVTEEINRLGGTVNRKFHFINALAASVSEDKIIELATNSQVKKIYLDAERRISTESLPVGGIEPPVKKLTPLRGEYRTVSLTGEQKLSLTPNNYWNPTAMVATPVWDQGYTGNGSLVAVIDTGIWTSHFMFAGTNVTGGVDLSIDAGNATYGGWDNPNNHYHGSHVAGILAGTGGITINASHPLVQSIELYTGETLPWYNQTANQKLLWLLGMAPDSDLYIIKIFDHTGGGVPESRVLAGIEHAIELKLNGTYDVDAISMSLGGGTLYDGRDLEDQLVDYASSVGITVIAAAGNEGPAPMTVSSPGTANTAITVGAAATPVQTRVFWDMQYGYPGIGYYLFTSETPQIIYFNSRGPTSDGRLKPTVSATGVSVLSAYIAEGAGGLAWASGTSMSTPAVSAAVALLNSYAENNFGGDVASPEDYRQAIVGGAVWLEGYNEYDQGAGFLNVNQSLDVLKEDTSLGDSAPDLPPLADLEDISNTAFRTSHTTDGLVERNYIASITNLSPGHKVDYIFSTTWLTHSINLEITNVDLGYNPLGINSFEVYIHTAERSVYSYWVDSANVYGDANFTITDEGATWSGNVSGGQPISYPTSIEPGYVKITIENDWTSYGLASCDLKITVKPKRLQDIFQFDAVKYGKIRDGESTSWINIPVPEDAVNATVKLEWIEDWMQYPTADLDMYIYWDRGYSYDGATFSSPETVVLKDATTIYVMVYGYTVHQDFERYRLTVRFE